MNNKTKKEKNNNLAQILALTAILALVLCLGVVLLIRVAKRNRNDQLGELAGLEESIENNNKEDMIGRLDEVQKYLEELESSVNESSLTLNTLYDTRDGEQTERVESVLEKIQGIDTELSEMMKAVNGMKSDISENREYDNSVIYDSFVEMYSKISEVNSQIKEVYGGLDDLEKTNKTEVITNIENVKSLVESQSQKSEEKMTSGFDGVNSLIGSKMTEVTNIFNSKTTEMNNNLTGKINDVDTSIQGKIKDVDTSIQGKLSDVDSSLTGKMSDMNTNLQNQMGEVNNSMQEKMTSMSNQTESGFADLKNDFSLGMNGILEAINQRFDTVDANIESVFQYVANGKRNIASALATIGTGVDKEEGSDLFEILTFDELSDKISHSQDISGSYMDGEAENPLTGAVEDSISLGKAAWVEGHYVIGNGNDNRANYERGYNVGYSDGLAQIYNARIEYTRHYHTGSSSSYGGCYTVPICHSHTADCYIRTDIVCKCMSGDDYNNDHYCDNCMHTPHSGNTCMASRYEMKLNCTKGTEVVGYDTGCGMYNGQPLSAYIVFP